MAFNPLSCAFYILFIDIKIASVMYQVELQVL